MLKLSQAILLGDSLKKPNPTVFLADAGNGPYGCALGGAFLASGYTVKEWAASTGYHSRLQSLWPWLTSEHIIRIGSMYMGVGSLYTIEQIADYARLIEPTEEPENQEPLEKENGEPEEEPEDERDTYSSMAVAQAQYSDQGVK